jgi:hypothetical protein
MLERKELEVGLEEASAARQWVDENYAFPLFKRDYGRSLVVSYCITMLRRVFCSHVQSEVILGCFHPSHDIFKAAIVQGH